MHHQGDVECGRQGPKVGCTKGQTKEGLFISAKQCNAKTKVKG